jgi:hypothetical protein
VRLLAIALLLPGLAFGQSFSQKMDSFRAPFQSGVVYSIAVQMEQTSATTGKPVLVGTATKIESFEIWKDVLLVDLVGPKTATVKPIITTLRVTLTATKGTGWWSEPFVFHAVIDKPFELPLAGVVGCRYDMPVQKLLFAMALPPFKFDETPAPGNLACAVGVKAASLVAPVVVPVSQIPPPDPDPVPPITGNSLPNDCSPPLPQLTLNGVWTVTGGKVFRDGAALLTNAYADLSMICIDGTTIRAISPTKGYERWNDTTKAWQ